MMSASHTVPPVTVTVTARVRPPVPVPVTVGRPGLPTHGLALGLKPGPALPARPGPGRVGALVVACIYKLY